MILNIHAGRTWLGSLLGRRGPVSAKTWRLLLDQGLPVGKVGGSPIISTEAVQEWLEDRATYISAPGLDVTMQAQGSRPAGSRRGPGRPRKNA